MKQEKIKSLIDLCLEGDEKSFETLVLTFRPIVFRWAFHLLGNDEKSQDVVQEVFIKMFLGLDSYNPQYAFATWLHKITRNQCYDELRSMIEHKQVSAIEKAEDIVSHTDVEQLVIYKDLKIWLLSFADNLTPKQRLVFVLSEIEGLKNSEIQITTGLTAIQVKSNLYLAKKNIKDKMLSLI